MLGYVVYRLWFSRYADPLIRRSQRRLLFLLVFSMAVLLAVGAVFSGFQEEFERNYQKPHKIWLMYGAPQRLEALYAWLHDQEDVTELTRYAQAWVKVSCGEREGVAWVREEPNYWHGRILVNELTLHMLGSSCGEMLQVTAYDISQILPVLHEASVPFDVVNMQGFSVPTIVLSSQLFERLHIRSDGLEALRLGLPKNKNVLLWLNAGGWSDIRAVDMSQWQLDFSQALFSQKMMMWLVMGLLLASAMFQLKHSVEDMLTQQKKFWALMLIHGLPRSMMVQIFSYYVAGYILLTLVLAGPIAMLLAYGLNPLVYAIERIFSIRILDPQFFITDHIPVAWVSMDIIGVGLCVFVMASMAVYFALRRSRAWDPVEVLKHV